MLRFRVMALAAITAVGLAFGPAAPATAGTPFGVSASTASCGELAEYTTQGGGGLVINPGAPCAHSGSAPTKPGLTSASVQVSSVVNSGAPEPGATGAGTVAADLSDGSLHAVASGSLPSGDEFGGAGPGNNGQASLWDTLTFTVAGANGSTVTEIPFAYSVDGSASDPSSESWGTFLQFATHGCEFNGCGVDPPGTLVWSQNEGCRCFFTVAGGINFASDPEPIDVTWQTPSVNNANDLTIDGDIWVTGPQATLNVGSELDVNAYVGSVDYGNTAALSFQPPVGTSLSSASGVFGTSAVPEPASWATILVGLFGVGAVLRARRRMIVAIA